jgi:hypothetical protein
MKIAVVLVLTFVSVLLIVGSTWWNVKISHTSEEKLIETSNQPNATANSNVSPAKNNAGTGSSEGQRASGNAPEGKLRSADESVPNGAPVETPDDQTAPRVSGNEAASANVPLPDGRVYSGGEEPYAYIPTYSPKQRLPIAPLPPNQ